MPVDMKRYPSVWPEVRAAVLRRAGGSVEDPRVGATCEQCGVRNYDVGYWADGRFLVAAHCNSYHDAKLVAENWMMGEEVEQRYIVVVITIAHFDDPDPHNIALDNLAGLCQKCHNVFDGPMRRKNAAVTRRQKRNVGQLEMF